MNERLYMIYRRKRPDGKESDRAIRVQAEGVEVRGGHTGEETKFLHVPRDNCLNKDPWAEMRWRRNHWVRDGYIRVGYGEYPDGRLQMVHEVETTAPEEQPKDTALALHWAANGYYAHDKLEELFLDIAKALKATGHVVGARSLYANGWTGLSVETPNRLWTIRQQPDGTLTAAGEDGAARLLEADGVVPVLVLMRIAREFPGTIEFLWLEQCDAWRVRPMLVPTDPYLGMGAGPYEDTLRVAEALGLCPTISLLANKVENDQPIVF